MTEPVPRAIRGRSFDAWAAEYDRYRPSYPPALFDLIEARLDLPARPRVADIGAGTGKVALAMADRGWEVTAVEPGEPMLEVLRHNAEARHLMLRTVTAKAEGTTLPSAAFDLVTAGEAYHWFDTSRALRECGRILRKGGGFASFWNVRDVDESPLMAEYAALGVLVGTAQSELRRPGPRAETREELVASGLFKEPVFEQIRHRVSMTGSEFIGLAFTMSDVRAAGASRQRQFGELLKELLARYGIDRTTAFDVPYVVDCWIAVRA